MTAPPPDPTLRLGPLRDGSPGGLVRRASAADAPAIARVEHEATDSPWSEAEVRSTLGAAATLAWVIGDPIVGHLLTSCVAEEAEILTLAVLPSWRRAGCASALLAACEATWREQGVVSAWLEVRVDNDGARALYQRRGWVEAGLRRAYYGDGTDAQVMRWSPSC